MLKFIIILVLSLVVGIFGWAQIIGCIQRIPARRGGLVGMLIFTLLLWVAIMGVGAYFAITKFDGLIPLLIGYGVSFVLVIRNGKIQ